MPNVLLVLFTLLPLAYLSIKASYKLCFPLILNTYDTPGTISSLPQLCQFCDLIGDSQILEETPDLIVIHDINPKAFIHLLIIPKRHIRNTYFLTPLDIPLLDQMQNLTKKLSKALNFTYYK